MKTFTAKHYLILILASLLFIVSCQSKHSLKRDIARIMAKDVKNYTKKALGTLTLGTGDKLINNLIDDKMQDSLVLNNFIVYVKNDLENIEDIKYLRELKRNKKTRNLFLLQSLVKNSETIKEDIKSKFVIGAILFDEILKLIKRQ
jgi:hypothetical protein